MYFILFSLAAAGMSYIYRSQVLSGIIGIILKCISAYTYTRQLLYKNAPLRHVSTVVLDNGHIVHDYTLYDSKGGSTDMCFVANQGAHPPADVLVRIAERCRDNHMLFISCTLHHHNDEENVIVDATKLLKRFCLHLSEAHTCKVGMFVEYISKTHGIDYVLLQNHKLSIYLNDDAFTNVSFTIRDTRDMSLYDLIGQGW